MNYFKKGTLVFVHTSSYPPWPAQIQRKYDNDLYKVNFIGQKSYTKIQLDQMDLFTQERARQIHNQLDDKKLSKAISLALKQFQNRKKKGQIDPDLIDYMKKNCTLLNLEAFKNGGKGISTSLTVGNTNVTSTKLANQIQSVTLNNNKTTTTTSLNISQPIKPSDLNLSIISNTYVPLNTKYYHKQDNFIQIGDILDQLCKFMALPFQQKLKPFLNETQYNQKRTRVDQKIARLKIFFQIEQEGMIKKDGENNNQILTQNKQNTKGSFSNKPQLQSSINNFTCKRVPTSQSSPFSSSISLIQKITTNRIIQRIILTIKTFQSFRQESKQYFDQNILINYLKQKLNFYYEKFKEEYNRKRLNIGNMNSGINNSMSGSMVFGNGSVSHKDRMMLEKFQSFQAFL